MKIRKNESIQHTEKIKRFGGTVSSHFDRSTTHVVFPREVDYQSGMDSLKSTTVGDTVVLVSIDWLSDWIGERKLVPTAQFQVRSKQFARVARERVPRVLRNAEKQGKTGKHGRGKNENQWKFERNPGNFKMAEVIAFFTSIAYPFVIQYFSAPFYGNNEVQRRYLCHQPQYN